MSTDDTGPVGGPTLTMGGAVRASGLSRSTMQRRLADGAIPGAHRAESGEWVIPYAGLVAGGLIAKRTPPDTVPDGGSLPMPAQPDGAQLRAELDQVRAELAQTRAERDTARALADERARHLADLREALAVMGRALTTPSTREPESGNPPPVTPTPTRRRWWHRG